MRRLTCRELGLKYRPDPVANPDQRRKVELPEDKLKAGMKERLVASLVATHEATEAKVDQVYRFEEKLKRTYFHVKPLEARQLRTWDQYLDWEVGQGDHERVVVLFERCLIPCALYEQFWAKYARYLEKAHKEGKDVSVGRARMELAGDVAKARAAFGTGLENVDQLREERASWTLQGWAEKETDKWGNQRMVMRAEEAPKVKKDATKKTKKKAKAVEEKPVEEEVMEDEEEAVEGEQEAEGETETVEDEDKVDEAVADGVDEEAPIEPVEAEPVIEEDLSKLKVVELRARLQERQLDSRGTKPALVGRLREALEAERQEQAESVMDVEEGEDKTAAEEGSQPKEPETEQEVNEEEEDVDEEEHEDVMEASLVENMASAGGLLDSATDHSSAVAGEMEEVVVSSAWQEVSGWEAVRDVYRRAAVVHCPKKAVIRMKWAQFEETIGEVGRAREILGELVDRYPMLVEARMQQIDLERRERKFEVAERMYTKLMKQIPSKHEKYKNMKTWIAMKFARFQFKICGNADKSLAALRNALKKERGNPKLYSQIIDICYQRQPVDVTGVTAAIELALVSKDLTNMAKMEFVQRKVEFMQEFGDVGRYRDAWDQLKMFRHLCSADLKVDARRKKELEEQEEKLARLDELRAHATAEANLKAKVAESEGRLLCSGCQGELRPGEDGVYDFERWRGGGQVAAQGQQQVVGPQGQTADEDTVIDLMDFDMDPAEEDKIKRSLETKTKYKQVAPTWELNIEKYGYGAKKRAHDPDYEHVETSKYREYERLEEEGYDEETKDPHADGTTGRKVRPAKGLGLKEGKEAKVNTEQKKFVTSDYIIPPKVPQSQHAPGPLETTRHRAPGELELEEHEQVAFELPPELADPSQSPCVNVPEWFVREGGELCLSSTAHGESVIRYWPKFLSEKGNDLMLNRLRRYCRSNLDFFSPRFGFVQALFPRWHQKQVKVAGEWKYQPRLVSWYGPCAYQFGGLTMQVGPPATSYMTPGNSFLTPDT